MRIKTLPALFIVSLFTSISVQAEDTPTIQIKYLSPQLTHKIVYTAVDACAKKGYTVAAAVVNRDGTLAAFLRNPLAGPHTEEVSQRKAYSSATFQTTTQQMADRVDIKFASRILLVQGGVPIEIGGIFYGAVAVSGAESSEDEACALAGIEAIRETVEFADN
jgi:uncharacterized protein GlcG (DUF336 family)